MNKLAHFCMLSAFAVGGCLHTVEGPQPLKAEGEVSLIDLTKPGNDVEGYRQLLGPDGKPGDLTKDGKVTTKCTAPLPPSDEEESKGALRTTGAVAAAVLPIVAGWVIDYAISTASSWAKQRLAEYSGVTAGAVRFGPPAAGYFYAQVPPPVLAVRCVRLRRFAEGTGADGKPIKFLAAEAILLVEMTSPRDALLITPLRLYFDVPVARTSSSSKADFGVSVGATFDALWQAEQTGEGKAVRIWSETVAAQKIRGAKDTSSARQRVFYYNLDSEKDSIDKSDSNPTVAVPLVPWSVPNRTGKNSAGGKSTGAGKLTLILAEVGDPPLILEIVAGTLNDHGKDIGDFLKDAAKKAIEKD